MKTFASTLLLLMFLSLSAPMVSPAVLDVRPRVVYVLAAEVTPSRRRRRNHYARWKCRA